MMIQGDDGYDGRFVLADHHWFVRLHLVSSMVFHWFVQLHCAATAGELNGFSLVCGAATFGRPMMLR